MAKTTKSRGTRSGVRAAPVRFAVVGLGHIAQRAVLPAFAHTKGACELTAIISDDPAKQKALARKYKVEHVYDYASYDEACRAGTFDAVYIALPNTMHREYTERAAAAGVHVLCEKPMATTTEDCRAMIDACERADVRLMIAYRLHFERASLEALKIARSGKLGDLRIFNSSFTMQAKEGNIRLDAGLGGGPLLDIGIYCLNAARTLFDEEPTEVVAMEVAGDDPRFEEVEEGVSVILRFPGERLATFTCSFGAADSGWYQLIGTKGDLCLDPAYEYQEGLEHTLTIKNKSKKRSFAERDQFAPELIAFGECVRSGTDPEPGGAEGLNDVRIIEAIRESARTGRLVPITDLETDPRPTEAQEIYRPPPAEPDLVNAESGHKE